MSRNSVLSSRSSVVARGLTMCLVLNTKYATQSPAMPIFQAMPTMPISSMAREQAFYAFHRMVQLTTAVVIQASVIILMLDIQGMHELANDTNQHCECLHQTELSWEHGILIMVAALQCYYQNTGPVTSRDYAPVMLDSAYSLGGHTLQRVPRAPIHPTDAKVSSLNGLMITSVLLSPSQNQSSCESVAVNLCFPWYSGTPPPTLVFLCKYMAFLLNSAVASVVVHDNGWWLQLLYMIILPAASATPPLSYSLCFLCFDLGPYYYIVTHSEFAEHQLILYLSAKVFFLYWRQHNGEKIIPGSQYLLCMGLEEPACLLVKAVFQQMLSAEVPTLRNQIAAFDPYLIEVMGKLCHPSPRDCSSYVTCLIILLECTRAILQGNIRLPIIIFFQKMFYVPWSSHLLKTIAYLPRWHIAYPTSAVQCTLEVAHLSVLLLHYNIQGSRAEADRGVIALVSFAYVPIFALCSNDDPAEEASNFIAYAIIKNHQRSVDFLHFYFKSILLDCASQVRNLWRIVLETQLSDFVSLALLNYRSVAFLGASYSSLASSHYQSSTVHCFGVWQLFMQEMRVLLLAWDAPNGLAEFYLYDITRRISICSNPGFCLLHTEILFANITLLQRSLSLYDKNLNSLMPHANSLMYSVVFRKPIFSSTCNSHALLMSNLCLDPGISSASVSFFTSVEPIGGECMRVGHYRRGIECIQH